MIETFKEERATILIADDNPDNLKIVAQILSICNYKIVIATNGEEAVELTRRTSPDLILLDVMMPKMDGFEACRIIKSDPGYKDIPVVFITALNDSGSLVKGFESGGVDYITKPFNKDELIRRVTTHVNLKSARDKLEHTAKHLAELNSLKDKMFSVIGHDLRSPLGSVKMTLEFLASTIEEKDDMGELVGIMLKATDDVFSLLENLLGWARTQSGNLSIIPETLNVNDLVSGIYFLNKGSIEQKQLQYNSAIDGGHTIWADLGIMKIVIRNLVSNAIKFTPEQGSLNITSESGGDKTRIIVADTGVGIAEDVLPQIFDPLKHYTSYGTNNESGSGLGLTLCKELVERSNGKLWVESEVGKGSSFFIELPSGTVSS